MSAGKPWKLGRRAGLCTGCETQFAAGAIATSALYVDDDHDPDEPGFARADWCADCFDDADMRGDPFSWWTAAVPEPEKRKAVFDLNVAREFLQRLLRDGDPTKASLRYLLTLLLMRKRIVKVLDQYPDERGDVMVVSLKGSEDETHEVVCVELDEAESDSLRDELGRLFDL